MSASPTKFSVTILGSNSALPAHGRHPTAQLLNVNHHYYLIDCGEGTQMQIRKYGLKMQRIKVIFISHMHGDHYYGLAGLLNSMHLLGRKKEVHIYAPQELKQILDLQLGASGGKLQFPIHFHELERTDGASVSIYSDKHVSVSTFELKHRIPCFGFRFEEAEKERSYLPEKGGPLGVRIEDIPRLKRGEDVELEGGRKVSAEEVTLPPSPIRSYTYCTDTLPLDSTAAYARGTHCLYHEATFIESDAQRAQATYHSTAREAARVAANAEARHLLIGHYSARYEFLDQHLKESREVFPNTDLTSEGLEVEIK